LGTVLAELEELARVKSRIGPHRQPSATIYLAVLLGVAMFSV
jgi:hypothetical protein